MPKIVKPKETLAEVLRRKLGPAPLWAHGFLLGRDINAIRRYLQTVTSSFDRRCKEDQESIQNLPEGISYEEMEALQEDHSEMQYCYTSRFPTFAFQTTFVASFSFLEDEMLTVARLFSQTRGDT